MSIKKSPSWSALNELALAQHGHFTAAQAAEAGFSRQLLRKHVLAGRMQRELRGVYRLSVYPIGELDQLIALWLWSGAVGVFSHETVLALFQLSDVLPARIHMTVPRSWKRSSAVPQVLMLHHADLPEHERTWLGAAPVTTLNRALRDAIDAGTDPTLVAQAAHEALARKLLTRSDVLGILPPNNRGRPVRRRRAGEQAVSDSGGVPRRPRAEAKATRR